MLARATSSAELARCMEYMEDGSLEGACCAIGCETPPTASTITGTTVSVRWTRYAATTSTYLPCTVFEQPVVAAARAVRDLATELLMFTAS